MQIRSKAGIRTVKLDAFEKRTLKNASVIAGELATLAQPEAREVAAKASECLDALLDQVEAEQVVVE